MKTESPKSVSVHTLLEKSSKDTINQQAEQGPDLYFQKLGGTPKNGAKNYQVCLMKGDGKENTISPALVYVNIDAVVQQL